METLKGVGAQVAKLSLEMVGMSGNSSPVECTNTIDQEHKASMNELTKMMAQMRQDADASERFCGGSGSAARTAAASSLDVCGLQAGATGHQHRHGDKMISDCLPNWRSKNGFRMVNVKRTGLRHRRSRRKCTKTCWMWTCRINSFGAIVKRNTEILTKKTKVNLWLAGFVPKEERKRKCCIRCGKCQKRNGTKSKTKI